MARTKKTQATAEKIAAAATQTKKKTMSKSTPTKRSYVRKTVSVHVQFNGMDWDTDRLADYASEIWAKEHGQKKTAAKDIRLYVKPEEDAVYFVINKDTGSFRLSDHGELSV